MHKKLHIKKIMAFSIILLVLVFFTTLLAPKVSAEVSINLSPSEGPVGTVVSVTGQISTANGSYKIFFADYPDPVTGNATQYEVSDTFTVLNKTVGSHPVILLDITTGENSTAYFSVQMRYSIKALTPPHPNQLQEGVNITILAIITGGNATTFANMTVTDPANVTHSFINVTIPIGQNGYCEANITYPADFDENPHTFYVGTYNMSLNMLNETVTGSFSMGLTDATEYYRFQTVHVQATNYTSTDILKVSIARDDETIFESAPKNASVTGGLIEANWTIPANASVGLYTVEVKLTNPPGTEKPVSDIQTFTIVPKSFACEVNAFNLEEEPVEGIVVEANNTFTFAISANTTNENGSAFFYLEATNYTFTAFLNDSQVGATSEISLAENLTGTSALSINCSLAHIRIAVKSAEGTLLPFIDLHANFTYTTRANITITSTVFTETNLTGIATFRNLFINADYTLKASRYDQTFNETSKNLTSTSWFNITCPTLEFIIKIFDGNSELLQDATVRVYDWGIGLSGLVGTGSTNTSGEVAFNFTFGRYLVKVYKDEILLNETSTYLINQPTNFAVYCKLYNLALDVSVLGYFGQGISNANVTIEREGTVLSSLNTAGNGIAQFTELIGGNYKIFVYIAEKPYEITTLYLQEPKTVVTLKIAKIVSISGFLIETSHFITIILILLLIAVFLLILIYRRFKSRRKKE